ncbi:3-deoxy-D-manno-octulosonate 8-phosphate phosphatase [Sulfurimonas hongkongensis]|uniref:3-deoxy-D-manno-octulosonate 8-phosphate phosphatase n=1 Tax=Sulfurimonas hongkongensis TaxID=1172190 RepID=T0L3A5_9BACT|nr:HAD hydrolase family protein [Sulfurimonas hongkongensis]EQB40328.1 3-deoxy-D-manno-octulosonate 8-phosphate phosphatase [Sulfurimonas hongkongensis]
MIKLIVLDVDGCLSDGKLIYSNDGVESKSFNVKDGLAISSWIKMGNHVAIITGRKSNIVTRRAKELGIKHLYQGVKDKQRVLRELIESLGLSFCEVAAIGDDLNDYHMLKLVKKSFAPSDGVKEIKGIVKIVLEKKGGDGVVREMIDILVDDNNQREDFMRVWI